MNWISLWRKHNQWLLLSFSRQERLRLSMSFESLHSLNDGGGRWRFEALGETLKWRTQKLNLAHWAADWLTTAVSPASVALNLLLLSHPQEVKLDYLWTLENNVLILAVGVRSIMSNERLLICMYVCEAVLLYSPACFLLLWLWD